MQKRIIFWQGLHVEKHRKAAPAITPSSSALPGLLLSTTGPLPVFTRKADFSFSPVLPRQPCPWFHWSAAYGSNDIRALKRIIQGILLSSIFPRSFYGMAVMGDNRGPQRALQRAATCFADCSCPNYANRFPLEQICAQAGFCAAIPALFPGFVKIAQKLDHETDCKFGHGIVRIAGSTFETAMPRFLASSRRGYGQRR